MRAITKEMIDKYNIKKLGYDFMGYTFDSPSELSFHHLIVPRKDCSKKGLGSGYVSWNGAILKQSTSHDYLHLIEKYDRELFLRITKEMIEENRKGYIDIENLKRIRELLLFFESLYATYLDRNEKKIIKTSFITNRITL